MPERERRILVYLVAQDHAHRTGDKVGRSRGRAKFQEAAGEVLAVRLELPVLRRFVASRAEAEQLTERRVSHYHRVDAELADVRHEVIGRLDKQNARRVVQHVVRHRVKQYLGLSQLDARAYRYLRHGRVGHGIEYAPQIRRSRSAPSSRLCAALRGYDAMRVSPFRKRDRHAELKEAGE